MYIYVYRITNLINQKEYVGVHTTWNLDDGYMGSGTAITRAIKKYGANNFQKEIIQFFDNETDAYKHELNIVNEEYVSRKDTYNLTVGGNKPPSRKGVKLNNETVERYRIISNTPERKKASSKGGLKGIRHVKENGWSQEAIAKRVKTRQERCGYSKDMSKCHTPEAIAKRNQSRKNNGSKYNTINANSPESRFRREKTKYLSKITKIAIHYNQPITLKLLKKSQKDKFSGINIKSLLKYFTKDEIYHLTCDALLTK